METIKPVEGNVVYSPPSRPSKTSSSGDSTTGIRNVAPQFVSPKGNIDPQTGVFVTEVRDTGTGQVTFQYPSKKAVAAYTRSNQSEKADVEPKQPVHGEGQAQPESKPKVEASPSADAVTDGTKDS
ncbi:MAG: hypothetical protein ISR51_04930 [Rhodospirillales bacterium]|nr:hypothetical protein [Alphaproteobacteria bacterium]MBL6948001.1 hypothetical protein [Rhodospirillales bacterium]